MMTEDFLISKGVEEQISEGAAVIPPTNVGPSGNCGGGGGVNLPGLLNTSTSLSTSSHILPWNGHNTNTNHHNISPSSSEAASLVALTVGNSTNSFGSGSSPVTSKGTGNKHGHNSRGETSAHTNGEHHDTTCLQASLGDPATNLRHRGSKGSSHTILNGLSNSGTTNHGSNGNIVSNGSASHGSTLGEVDYMEKMKEEATGHHLDNHTMSKSSNGFLSGSNNVPAPNTSGNLSVGGSNKSNKPSGGSGSTPRDASRKNRGDGSSSGKQGSSKEIDPTAKMETDLKKLKVDLQISRNKENDLRDQIISFMSSK